MADTDAVPAVENEEQDDAAFAAGFAEASGDEPVAEAKPAEEAAPATEEPKTEEPKAEEPEGESVTLNHTEVKALLGRLEELDKVKGGLRDAFGRLGTVSETLNKLKTAQGTGGNVEISEEDLAELSEFGELKSSVGTVLKRVLSKVGTGGAPAQPVDLEPVKQEFATKLEERDRQFEQRILTAYHRDWRGVVQSDPYRTWLATQPEDYRNRISNSWNAEEIAESIDTFKAASTAKTTNQVSKTRRLEAAVAAPGNARAAPAINEDEAFLSGFKAARGG